MGGDSHTRHMRSQRFKAEVYAGHTTDCGALVPFDPAEKWKGTQLLSIGYRKHDGYAVQGSVNGVPFESWVFFYFKQWRLIVPNPALDSAHVAVGEVASFTLRPHQHPEDNPKFTPGPKRS